MGRRIEHHATDKQLGMTTGEIVEALADTPDHISPTVTVGWRGQIKILTIDTTHGHPQES